MENVMNITTLKQRRGNQWILSLVAVAALMIAGCGDDPRDMSYGQFRRLTGEERMKILKELSESEVRDITAVTVGHRADSASLDSMTLRSIISEGEKIRYRIEQVPPTR
jgi:hypothetical protein